MTVTAAMAAPAARVLASIPSPSHGVWHLGPIPLRGYALCIILGVIVGSMIAERRLRARGAPQGLGGDIAVWGVPCGIIGARLYHVITTPDPYFGAGGHPIEALYVWRGGLGIWGAIAGGAIGGAIAVRRAGVPFRVGADACAPGIVVAQAIGRWGNWFNQELYGRPSTLPWAVHIDPQNQIVPGVATYHPTFLYESLWCLGTAVVVLLAERRWHLARGRVFALYVAVYTVGRAWIEALRIDTAHRFFGLRLNDYVSVVVFGIAVAYLIRHRGQQETWTPPDAPPPPDSTDPVQPDAETTATATATATHASADEASRSAPSTVE